MIDHLLVDVIEAVHHSFDQALLQRQAVEERFQVDVFLGDISFETSYSPVSYTHLPAIEAMRRAIAAGHDANASVALSLSDPFCVSRHQHEFLDLLREDIDVLFGNEDELLALFSAPSFDSAIEAAEETGILVAATRGAKGSVVTTPHGPVAVDAAPVDRVLDTTGAGDLYAAGFLYGLTHGADPQRCAELGGLCAAEVIGHFGARPEADLRALAEDADLL